MSMRIRVKKKERGHDPEKHSVDKGLCEIAQPLSDISDGIESDVLGSYTGIAADGSAPQQDADDLSMRTQRRVRTYKLRQISFRLSE